MENLLGGGSSTVTFDQDKYEYHRHVETVVIPAGTTVKKPTALELNTDYDECIGIATYDIGAANEPSWSLGLDYKDGDEIQAHTTALDWLSASPVSYILANNLPVVPTRNFAELYKPVSIPVVGSKSKVQFKFNSGTATAAELTLNFVFLMRRERRK